jgi:sterol desaturase/sphingolipid hydroxylase (fatty acid hydroxylase superfamily)
VILTRGLTYVPIFVLGFSNAALMAYVFLVAAQATFIHANVRWRLRPVRRLIATPAFHHWHHSADREAVDKNFAVHTPVWDILFGTYYLRTVGRPHMVSAASATFRAAGSNSCSIHSFA